MSIINDALKKAEKSKQPISEQKSQAVKNFGNFGHIKSDMKTYFLKRRLLRFFWSATALVCLLGIILAVKAFYTPSEEFVLKSPLAENQEMGLQKKAPMNILGLRKVDIEIPAHDPNFKLSGILYDEQRPLAIINEKVIEEGALVNGARLLEITPDSVRLSYREEEFTLSIK